MIKKLILFGLMLSFSLTTIAEERMLCEDGGETPAHLIGRYIDLSSDGPAIYTVSKNSIILESFNFELPTKSCMKDGLRFISGKWLDKYGGIQVENYIFEVLESGFVGRWTVRTDLHDNFYTTDEYFMDAEVHIWQRDKLSRPQSN